MRTKWIIGSVLLILAVISIVKFQPSWVSSGTLLTGHHKIEDDCFKCHDLFQGATTKKCVACHKLSEIGITKPSQKAFHQKITTNDCTACHTDHKGLTGKSTRAFSHELLVESVQSQCMSCHVRPKDKLHSKIKDECGSCHRTDQWKSATFDHSRYFIFDRHHPSDCESCHAGQSYDTYTCYSCHEHSPSDVEQEHWEEGIRNFKNCVACHRSGDEDEAERIWKDMRRRGVSPDSVGAGEWSQGIGSKRPDIPTNRNYRNRHDEHDD